MAYDHHSPAPAPTVEQLEAAAMHLRRNERAVLELAARGRLTNAAIAERLGIPVHVTERLLARALRKLDRALERL
jgi:DNA-directed RNA polymerase specialized sigma24 family protein